MNSVLSYPIICVAPVEWHSLRQRPQVIMEHFRELTQVYYLEPVGLRSVRLSDIYRIWKKLRQLVYPSTTPSVLTNLEILTPWYVPFSWAGSVNNLLFSHLSKKIREVCRKKPILWIGSPSSLAVYLLDHFDYALSVYDCMDDFAAFHNNSSLIREREKQIVEQVDMVLAVSKSLYNKVVSRARRVSMVPNGVDLKLFHPFGHGTERPSDLPAGKTIIGYHGVIGGWFDLGLVCRLAESRPQWQFVLIGPKTVKIDMSVVPQNITFLGPKSHEVLPRYLSFFDVGIIPFTESAVSYHSNPIKAYEYLAMGIPVVSIKIIELMKLNNVVYVASGPDRFLQEIEQALSQRHYQHEVRERLAVAQAHSWDLVFQSILEQLPSIG